MWSFWTLSLLTRGGYLLIGSAGVGKEICGSKTFFNNTFLLVMCTFSLKYWTEQLVLSHVSVLKENYICNVHLIFSTHLYVTASGGVLLSGTGKYIISGRIDINGWLLWKLYDGHPPDRTCTNIEPRYLGGSFYSFRWQASNVQLVI